MIVLYIAYHCAVQLQMWNAEHQTTIAAHRTAQGMPTDLEASEFLTGTFFPSLPLVRCLLRYAAPQRAATHCNKNSYCGRDVTHGILVAVCLHCSGVLGFAAMKGG